MQNTLVFIWDRKRGIVKEQNDRIGHVKEQMEDMSKKSAAAVREGEQSREDAQKKMAEIARQMRNLNKVVEGLQFASMAEESMVNSFLTVNNKKAKAIPALISK